MHRVREIRGHTQNATHITTSAVLTTTAWTPPPRMGSAITGSVSLVIMFARRRVTKRRWPFLRIGLILLAYSFCLLKRSSASSEELLHKEMSETHTLYRLCSAHLVESRRGTYNPVLDRQIYQKE